MNEQYHEDGKGKVFYKPSLFIYFDWLSIFLGCLWGESVIPSPSEHFCFLRLRWLCGFVTWDQSAAFTQQKHKSLSSASILRFTIATSPSCHQHMLKKQTIIVLQPTHSQRTVVTVMIRWFGPEYRKWNIYGSCILSVWLLWAVFCFLLALHG